jgi:hypothetical protein
MDRADANIAEFHEAGLGHIQSMFPTARQLGALDRGIFSWE